MIVHAPAHARVDAQFAVTLEVQGASHVAGYEAIVLYDRAAAEFSGVLGPGRPLGPVDGPRGEFVGAFTLSPRTHVLGTGQTVRILMTAHRAGRLQLRIADVRVVSFSGRAIPLAAPTRTVAVQVGAQSGVYAAPAPTLLPARSSAAGSTRDVTGDGALNRSDLDDVAMDWSTARMDGRICGDRYIPTAADANVDGCLDVGDVQRFASATGNARRVNRGLSALSGANALNLALPNPTITVNSTGDGSDAAAGNGVCATSSGDCTLRAAIQEANAESGANTINFNIAGTGVQTIQLSGQLPTITDASGATTIDGYTQPGAAPNTDQYADNANIEIQIRGGGASAFDGLRISSANNVIKGLAFFNLRQSIWTQSSTGGANGNSIQGNFIGTNAAGTFGFAIYVLDATGVEVRDGSNGNHIGEPTLAGRNVISGNARHGMACFHATNTLVYNNIVGLSPDGTRALKNVKIGADWNSNCANNIIGGTGPLQRNIFSGNTDPALQDYGSGVELSHSPGNTGNQIVGNCFGTDVTCTSAPAYAKNTELGIRIEDTASNAVVRDNVIVQAPFGGLKIEDNGTNGTIVTNNRIGVLPNGQAAGNGTFGVRINNGAKHMTIGPGNVIAFNNGVGVQLQDGPRVGNTIDNTITQNSIFANTGLGIQLDPDSATPGDLGPNAFLAYPLITSAAAAAVSGTACSGCTVEVFISDGDPSGYGEGKTFVGSTTADSTGNFSLATTGLTPGQKVTATATDGAGNTSQFSANATVASGASIPNAPVLDSARAGDGSVSLMWSSPASDGGSPVTNYDIYRGTGSLGETLLTQVGNVTGYTDNTAQDGTTYWYRISAVNSSGEGPPSNEFSSTPDPVIVSDSFERTVAAGFGTADVGGPWTVTSTAMTKVANGEGVIYGWTAGNQNVSASIPTVRSNMEVLSLVRLNGTNPVGASYQARVVARAQTEARNGYYARITHTTSGAAQWALLRVDHAGGTGTATLASGTLLSSGAAGTRWWVRLRVQGTNVQARFWQAGATEPSTWKATVSDSYWASGASSVGVYAGSGLSSPFPDTGFASVDAVDLG